MKEVFDFILTGEKNQKEEFEKLKKMVFATFDELEASVQEELQHLKERNSEQFEDNQEIEEEEEGIQEIIKIKEIYLEILKDVEKLKIFQEDADRPKMFEEIMKSMEIKFEAILVDSLVKTETREKLEIKNALTKANEFADLVRIIMMVVIGVTFCLVIIITFVIGRTLTVPIIKLKDAAVLIGEGNYDIPIEVRSKDEIGTLANTFNTMAGQIKERTESLVKSNEERQQLAYELKQTNRELEERNVEMEQFTFRVSHDLRAPLVNIKGFAGELGTSLETLNSTLNDALPGLEKKLRNTVNPIINKDIPESLDFINSSVTRMDQLINAILKLARLEKRVMDFQPLKMNELVQSTLKTLAHQIEKRKIKVTVSNLPQVMADRTSMDQIMGNLLSNAINYLDDKRPGVIEISADCKDLWRVLRSATTAAALPKGTRKEYFKSSAAPESRMCPEKASGWPMSNPSSATTKAASGAIRRWAKAPPFYLPFPIICHKGTPNDSTWTCHPTSCRG
ncbi:MAG: HAMP domain-containing protein [Nitrospinae bacterium]|nr:HAMP domain-containing protein [Nitrospinota bacterium]